MAQTIGQWFRTTATAANARGVPPARMVAWGETTGGEIRRELVIALGEELGEAVACALAEGLAGPGLALGPVDGGASGDDLGDVEFTG